HPRLRHQKKNLRRDRQRHGSRRARHYAGALQNLHEVEVVVPRIHRRTPRHPRAKNPAPRKPHPASPCINSMALARKLAPITLLRLMDTDRNGRVSKAEFMHFMAEEFDRLDVDHSGELDPEELSRSRLRVNPSWHK